MRENSSLFNEKIAFETGVPLQQDLESGGQFLNRDLKDIARRGSIPGSSIALLFSRAQQVSQQAVRPRH